MGKLMLLSTMSTVKGNDKKYSEHIKDVETAIKKLQNCDDVDDALDLFEQASTSLDLCQAKLDAAKGKFEVIKELRV